MFLKRKRSEDEFSFSSSSSAFNSPQRLDQHTGLSFCFTSMDVDASCSRNLTPTHLHSRTMKRFRNSRPSEVEVHQRTLALLFSAQKQQQEHVDSHMQMQVESEPIPQRQQHSSAQQASLHNFWKLPILSASSDLSSPLIDHSMFAPADCEDCGQSLRGPDEGDFMEVDGLGTEAEMSCGSCGKHVCSHCSISNLGEQKRCLTCAGKKVWGPQMDDGCWRC